jgi:hypothetical protein
MSTEAKSFSTLSLLLVFSFAVPGSCIVLSMLSSLQISSKLSFFPFNLITTYCLSFNEGNHRSNCPFTPLQYNGTK